LEGVVASLTHNKRALWNAKLLATLLVAACQADGLSTAPGDGTDESGLSTERDDDLVDAGSVARMDASAPKEDKRPDASRANLEPDAMTADANVGAGADGATSGPSSSIWPLTDRSFKTTHESHVKDAPHFNITRPVDLSAAGGTLPVVVWANGGCLRSDFSWQPMFDRWAGAGFVVLSLTGTTDGQGLDALFGMLGSTTEAEHLALIDWVEKANLSGPYAGKLDLERIVLAGNSCGGVTALQSAARDKRAAAVFVLSGSSAVGSVDEAVMKAIEIPIGYVVGGEEDIAGVNAKKDYEASREGVPVILVSRSEGDHVTVSTDAMILPQNAEISLQWMDLALYGTEAAYDSLKSPTVCSTCPAGDWTLTAKNLETLRK
jgi:hypothetical protein